tara:strand:- start:149 stop:412 length:264 start_codon:yes stop_codon:yes gene_type:complete
VTQTTFNISSAIKSLITLKNGLENKHYIDDSLDHQLSTLQAGAILISTLVSMYGPEFFTKKEILFILEIKNLIDYEATKITHDKFAE